MEQVAAKQRIKVAAKDHVLISRLHFRLHLKAVLLNVSIFLFLSLVTVAIFGMAVVGITAEVILGIMIVVMVLAIIAAEVILGRNK